MLDRVGQPRSSAETLKASARWATGTAGEASKRPGGMPSLPTRRPWSARGSIPTTTTAGDQTHLGGVVLILCGVDANGNHYDSEMLVFHSGHGLQVINPVYWGTTRIADSANPVPPETFPPVIC